MNRGRHFFTAYPVAPTQQFAQQVYSYSPIFLHIQSASISTPNLSIQIRVQEIIMRIRNTERRSQKRLSRGPFSGITANILALKSHSAVIGREYTHIVKQSYIKLNAAGPTTVLTSSGIGGA